MSALFRARFSTPAGWTLEAFGRSEESAGEALRRGWAIHARESGAAPGYLDRFKDEISVQRVPAGSCWRDGRQIA